MRVLIGCLLWAVIGCLGEELHVPLDPDHRLPPPIYPMGIFKSGAVVANAAPCAAIGNKILKKYGNAVDAMIATMICDGVACPQNMGVGGGFLMTIYKRDQGKAYALNAREAAPAAAHKNMFDGIPFKARFGAKAVAVPGELKGYEAAYKRFGGAAPWEELFRDTIQLCRDGVPVDRHFAESLEGRESDIRHSETLREMLLNANKQLPKIGDKIKFPRLADFLEKVANSGSSSILYKGSLTKAFVKDITDGGGIITEADMNNYEALWVDPVSVKIKDSAGKSLRLFSVPPPGSGVILAMTLRILDGMLPSKDPLTDVQRITEALKHAYGSRTKLGDPKFTNVKEVLDSLNNDTFIMEKRRMINDNATHKDPKDYGAMFTGPEDHGTANLVVVSPNGDAVVATSTVNLIFGSKFVSRHTGMLLNNEMDDFSSPKIVNAFGVSPSEANFIMPGKRPLSSMCPTVIVNPDGSVRLAVGAAGGSKITSSTALVTIWNLWYNKTIKQAMDEPRFHHQLMPNNWLYEYGILRKITEGMKAKGHDVKRLEAALISSTATAVAVNGNVLTASFDPRRPGSVAGL